MITISPDIESVLIFPLISSYYVPSLMAWEWLTVLGHVHNDFNAWPMLQQVRAEQCECSSVSLLLSVTSR